MKIFGRRDMAPDDAPAWPAPIAGTPADPRTAPRGPERAPERAGERAGERADFGARLRERVLREVDPGIVAGLQPAALQRYIEDIIHTIADADRLEVSARDQSALAEELANDMTGYGPLQSVLLDPAVTDIMVNSPYSVYVERAGKLERTDIRFRDNDHIIAIAQKIAARIGRRVDEASPMVDARLPDGSRVNIILPPLAIDSPCISIRRFANRNLDLQGMAANGTLSPGVARILEISARCRLNILISGGTGSGKTTLLNAMSRMIDHGERIISVEDAAELQLQQPHVIRLETRPPSLEGSGRVTQRDLVWNALRMRPDRIIVGEVRGPEAFDMLQAMNTGHDGSISTIHANSARDALTRVENMVQMGHFNLPLQAIRAQIVGAIDLLVHTERMRDGVRRVLQVTEVAGLEGDVITTNDIVRFKAENEDSSGRISGRYESTAGIPAFYGRIAYFGLASAWTDALKAI